MNEAADNVYKVLLHFPPSWLFVNDVEMGINVNCFLCLKVNVYKDALDDKAWVHLKI